MDGSGWEYLERYSEDYDKHIEKLNKQIERLKEQLNEANELISVLFPLSMNKERALERTTEYMEKWGVK